MICVVCYDIPDQKRRTRLHKTLEGFGDPVQESVFECDLTPLQKRKMVQKIEKIVELPADKVRIYMLCEECRPKIEIMGEGKVETTQAFVIV